MTTLFLITGSTGEYSDRTDWSVGYVTTRKEAEEWVTNANAWLKANDMGYDSKIRNYMELRKNTPAFDPNFYCDYTGAGYQYDEINLIYDVPPSPDTI